MEDEYINLLKWCAQKAGVRFLVISRWPEEGFQEVRIHSEGTFYGINTSLNWHNLNSVNNADEARAHGYISNNFQNIFFDRAHRIIKDMLIRSKQEGFEFYNGKLARLKKVDIKSGNSPSDEVLEIHIDYTSYFSHIGTNMHFQGYHYSYEAFNDELPLSTELKWPNSSNWKDSLEKSSFANIFAIHLFLYNEYEILYINRSKVGQESGKWNSTVNGIMEFSENNPDCIANIPNVNATAYRETLNELNIIIDQSKIRWIGLGATLDRCEPFLVGVCKIIDRKDSIAKTAVEGMEQRELYDKNKSNFRIKNIHSIPLRSVIKKEDINLGPFSFTLPIPLQLKKNLQSLILDKIINRQEKISFRKNEKWTDSGAASLLLCLAHLCSRERLFKILKELKMEIEEM